MIKGIGSLKEEIEIAKNSDLDIFFTLLNFEVTEIFNPDVFHF